MDGTVKGGLLSRDFDFFFSGNGITKRTSRQAAVAKGFLEGFWIIIFAFLLLQAVLLGTRGLSLREQMVPL